jgi:hypothetical protein
MSEDEDEKVTIPIQRYTPEERDTIPREGEEAFARVNSGRSSEEWDRIGAAQAYFIHLAADQLGQTVLVFGDDLDLDPDVLKMALNLFQAWEVKASNAKALEKQDRYNLRIMHFNEKFKAWRAELLPEQRRKASNPGYLVSRWKRSLLPKLPKRTFQDNLARDILIIDKSLGKLDSPEEKRDYISAFNAMLEHQLKDVVEVEVEVEDEAVGSKLNLIDEVEVEVEDLISIPIPEYEKLKIYQEFMTDPDIQAALEDFWDGKYEFKGPEEFYTVSLYSDGSYVIDPFTEQDRAEGKEPLTRRQAYWRKLELEEQQEDEDEDEEATGAEAGVDANRYKG